METVRAVTSMFMGELKTARIAFELQVTDSFKQQRLDVTEVMVDPSRLSQILINLTGNAIKVWLTVARLCSAEADFYSSRKQSLSEKSRYE